MSSTLLKSIFFGALLLLLANSLLGQPQTSEPTKPKSSKELLRSVPGEELMSAYKDAVDKGKGQVKVRETEVSRDVARKRLKALGLYALMFQDPETQNNLDDVSNEVLLGAYQDAVENGMTEVRLKTQDNHQFSVPIKIAKEELKKRGLYEPFAAVFNGALWLAATGDGTVRSAQDSIQPQFRGTIDWESEHFAGDSGFRKFLHFSFGGTFGYAPIMVLTTLDKNGTAEGGAPRPLFQQGLVWDITPRLNSRVYESGEVSVFGRLGQTWYTSEVTSFKAGDDTIVATVINNDVGRAATFWETGAEFRMFRKPLTIVHGEKSYVTPAFSASGGFREDTRFKRSGLISDYDHPESRTFVRFLVSLDKVFFPKTADQPQSTFSASFGVDYERPLSEPRVPAVTRLVFKSDIDLFKLFQTGKKQDPAKSGS